MYLDLLCHVPVISRKQESISGNKPPSSEDTMCLLRFFWVYPSSQASICITLPYVSSFVCITFSFRIHKVSTLNCSQDTYKTYTPWQTNKIFPMHINSESRMVFLDTSCTFQFFLSKIKVLWALQWPSVPWLFLRSNELLKHIAIKNILSTKSYVPEEDLSEHKGLVDLSLVDQPLNILANKYFGSQGETHIVI